MMKSHLRRCGGNGRAAVAPDAVAFINALPDNGKLLIRTTRSDGKIKEGNFKLGTGI
jgi:hypothetical protein